MVKCTIYRCVICRRDQGKSPVSPPSTSSPACRVAADFCFQSTEDNFADPLFVKSNYLPDLNQLYKEHVCLFTCATGRAVHLELVPDLEGQTFIRALKQFIVRRVRRARRVRRGVLRVTNLNGLPHSLLSYGHLIPGERACTGRTCLIKKFFQGPSKGRYIPWAVPEDSGYWLNGVLRGWSANG